MSSYFRGIEGQIRSGFQVCQLLCAFFVARIFANWIRDSCRKCKSLPSRPVRRSQRFLKVVRRVPNGPGIANKSLTGGNSGVLGGVYVG